MFGLNLTTINQAIKAKFKSTKWFNIGSCIRGILVLQKDKELSHTIAV